MSFLGLRHAALPTHDLTRALEFYREFVGFTDYHVRDADWVMLEKAGTTLSLVRMPDGIPVRKDPSETDGFAEKKKRRYHPSHLGLTVSHPSDLAPLHARLKAAGHPVGPIETHRDGSQGFYLLDPDKNQLEVIFIPAVSSRNSAWFPADGSEALVLLAHGSRDPAWGEPFDRMLAHFRRHLPAGTAVALAYLEGGSPTLAEATSKLLESTNVLRRVHVLPIFLSNGGAHAQRDIPALVNEARRLHPTLEWVPHPALGESEAVMDAFMMAALSSVRDARPFASP